MDATDDLIRAALACREMAYAPYSRFKVGAALRTPTGAVFVGCNVENAAYPLGVCAEAGAICAMAAAGERRIDEIVVVGGADDALVPPCGACRQRIYEFSDRATRIVLASASGARRVYSCDALLPHAFDLEAPGAARPAADAPDGRVS
jgi:cytidine deaminase